MVEKGDNKKHLLHVSGNTSDIISAIMLADKQCAPYTKDLAKQLRKSNITATCRNIWQWVKDNIEYKEDPEGYQFIQLPGYLYWGAKGNKKGQGDCKSMSVFCASLLQNLGLTYAYRFISQDPGADYHHVFVVLKDESGKTITLDCVDDTFNHTQRFAKLKDVVGNQHSKIGSFTAGGKPILNTGTFINVDGYGSFPSWVDFIAKYPSIVGPAYEKNKKILFDKVSEDWRTMARLAFLEPISILLLAAKGKDKQQGYFRSILDDGALHQLMYCYWDDKRAIFPDNLKAKREQAFIFKDGLLNSKVNLRRTATKVDTGKTPFWTEFNLRLFCDWHCFQTYGYPMAVCLEKAYNVVNLGTESLPQPGAPYFSLRENKWIENGATAQQMGWIKGFCLPASPQGKWITLYGQTQPTWEPNYNPTASSHYVPYGIPYWANGGFVMSNGADQVAVDLYKKENPAPPTLDTLDKKIARGELQPGTALQVIQQYTTFYNKLVLDPMYSLNNSSVFNRPGGFKGSGSSYNAANYAGIKPFDTRVTTITPEEQIRPTVTATSNFTVRGYSPKIGAVQLAVLIPLITAVVTLVAGLIGIIMAAINKSKSQQQIEADISNLPVDFQNSYQAVDGCYMEAVNIGGQLSYNKRCPDGTITPNANPNDPNNMPAYAPGGLFGSTNSKLLLILGLAAAGLYLLFSSSKKSKK
jgi:hypothetical protein